MPHFSCTVIELFVAFGRCTDIHVIDGDIHIGVVLLEQNRILDGIHTAEVGAGGIITLIREPTQLINANFLGVFHGRWGRIRFPAVGPAELLRRFHLHGGDDIGEAAVAVFRHNAWVKVTVTRSDDDRPMSSSTSLSS